MYPDDRNRRDHLLVNAFEVARLRARERERESHSSCEIMQRALFSAD